MVVTDVLSTILPKVSNQGGFFCSFIFKKCINCSYATGFSYIVNQQPYTGVSITGSYWTGIKENQVTGYEKVIGTFIKTDKSTGTFYYDSGKNGTVEVYQSLNPLYQNILLTDLLTGTNVEIDVNKKYSQTKWY